MITYRLIPTCLGILLLFGGRVSGQWQDWTNANQTHRWNDPENWSTKQIPTAETDGVALNVLPGPQISKTAAAVKGFVNIGATCDSQLIISQGGSLQVETAVALGCADKVKGMLVMQEGSSLTVDQVYVGIGAKDFGGKGHVVLEGGTINCTYFAIARGGDLRAEGSLLLKGGTLHCWDFSMSRDCIIPPRADIWDGKIVQSRNDVKRVKDWVHSKWIVAYGGKGKVIVEFDTAEHPGCTVIHAEKKTSEQSSNGTISPHIIALATSLFGQTIEFSGGPNQHITATHRRRREAQFPQWVRVQ